MFEEILGHFGFDGEVHGLVDAQSFKTSGETVKVEDPATGGVIASFSEATDREVADAVESAALAFSERWRAPRPVARAQTLFRIAQLLRDELEPLARLESLDTGKPIRVARGDIETSARYFEFYAGAADKIYGETMPGEGSYWSYTLREPYGVVAHIVPWNASLMQMARGVAPSLAAGNTVVVKPSEVTPLSSIAAGELFLRAGLPAGVCNVIPGRGRTTGAAVVRHKDIGYVGFTGSVETGKEVLRMAAERVVGCSLEFGGKSPTLVLADADMDAAVQAGMLAVVRNSGQSCFATTRLFVHESIAEEYSERLSQAVSTLSVGHGLDDPDLGPLASATQLDKVLSLLSAGQAEGARLAIGGDRPEGLSGHFLTPAVLTGVTNDMSVARNEIFGPVQSILTFSDLDDAVAMANDTSYGLAAGVFTRDLSTAHRLARRLEAGQVLINRYPVGGVETPFGGYKESGIGRERGLAALEHYTQLKTVIIAE